MTITNETLLPTTTYGVPSGNYDGSSTYFIGNAVPAANYYNGQGSAQTVVLQVNNFVGNITIQGTLDSWVEQANWFDIESYGDIGNATTNTTAINITGNFAWVRATVAGFTGGVINSANVVF